MRRSLEGRNALITGANHAIVTRIQPDVLVKGSDWGPDNIVGRDIVEARGGRVVRVELAPGHSTTDLIRRTRETGAR